LCATVKEFHCHCRPAFDKEMLIFWPILYKLYLPHGYSRRHGRHVGCVYGWSGLFTLWCCLWIFSV